jgi:hypothetical protein
VHPQADRREHAERLRDLRVATPIRPPQIDRRARVELDERLASAAPADEHRGPREPQRVERIRPAEVAARSLLREREGGGDAAAREVV